MPKIKTKQNFPPPDPPTDVIVPISTAMRIGTTPVARLPVPKADKEDLPPGVSAIVYQNEGAGASGGLPVNPPTLEFTEDFALARGVYLLTAPTGAGKTVLSVALVAWANAVGIPATYISCFEPRSPKWNAAGTQVFRNPQSFWGDVRKTAAVSPTLKLLVYDSATLPLKAASGLLKNQSTFPGGMQPTDRFFCDLGSDMCADKNACIILNINSTLVPYVNDLAGGTEGLIVIQNVYSFTYMDRSGTSARNMLTQTIPSEFVQGALSRLDMGTLRSSTSYARSRGFQGLKFNLS